MNEQVRIHILVLQRDSLLKANSEDERVDSMSQEIWEELRKHQDNLPVEFILESLTMLGAAPSLIYDDNGHWTVGGDGTQNMIDEEDHDKETTFHGSWWVAPNGWRRTIREAIRDYLVER